MPHLEISWTTRFNAFVPDHDSFNYVKKWIRGQPKKNSAPYGSDNEGTRLWPATVLTSSSRAAAVPYVRATRTRLLRRVRTRGAGQLGPRRHAPSRSMYNAADLGGAHHVLGESTSLGRARHTAHRGTPGRTSRTTWTR